MASSGKKGKKTKGKTFALTDFLQETPGATPTIPIRKTNLNWADEVEDVCDQYESRPKANVVLPTAPKASRGFDEFSEKIPQQAPFVAYLSNLPYDVTEDEIRDFFRDFNISSLKIPKEEREASRLKGFGYVEFHDRDSLVGALSIIDCTLKNRRIRIEIATNSDNDRRRGGRMDSNRDRADRPETSGDWRSGPRVEPTEPERSSRGGGGFNRDRDRDRDGGGGGGGFDRDRGGGGGFDRDRGGGGFDRDRGSERDRGGSWRDSTDRPSFRDMDRDRGGFHRGDSDRGREGFGDRNRFNDRDGDKRSFGPPRRGEREDREFTRGGGGGGGGGGGPPRDDMGSDRSDARTRPKLLLAPRSKPVEGPAAIESEQDSALTEVKEAIPPTTSVPGSSSIFGNAKPVDTSIRERQIEDRLAKLGEKSESSRDSRRDGGDRRDWGKREDEDGKWQSKRRESPRRGSPRRYSPRRSSPQYRRDNSPDRSRDSYDKGGESVDDRKASPTRSASPQQRRRSPDNRRSSLDRGRGSPERGRRSPEQRRYSPERRKGSSDGRWASPERRRDSPYRRKDSPERRRASPDRKWGSQEGRRGSPERSQLNRGNMQQRNDDKDKRGPSKSDRPPQKNDRERSKREDRPSKDSHDKEMPKLKEPEPPNFAASNKYAFLAEGDSD